MPGTHCSACGAPELHAQEDCPVGRTFLAADQARVDHLIAQSSLGTPEALALRERTPKAVVDRIMERLVSPNGFDGHGPVPKEVNDAARRIAHLRVKFLTQGGLENPLTVDEIGEVFDDAALQAEWMRELYEKGMELDGG